MDINTLAILAMVVVLPVCIVFGYLAFDRWAKLKQAQIEAVSNETAERAAQYAAKTERLEQRMAVIERILTDQSTALANEIEDLREERVE